MPDTSIQPRSGPIYRFIASHVQEKNESLDFRVSVLDLLKWAEEQDALMRELMNVVLQAARQCERCGGTGTVWVPDGKDSAHQDPCDDCFDYYMVLNHVEAKEFVL